MNCELSKPLFSKKLYSNIHVIQSFWNLLVVVVIPLIPALQGQWQVDGSLSFRAARAAQWNPVLENQNKELCVFVL